MTIFNELEDVYFVQEVPHAGCLKIGWSQFADERIKDLQTGNWRDLRIVLSITLPQGLAWPLEQFIHKKLISRNVRDEWFRIEPEEITHIVADTLNRFFESQPFDIQKLLAEFTNAPITGELYKRLSRYHACVSFHKRWRLTHEGHERHLQAQRDNEDKLPYFLEEG